MGRKRKIKAYFFLLIIILPTALSIAEENYGSDFEEKVLPFYRNLTFGEFQGERNTTISYAAYILPTEIERGAIVIFPGKSESYVKYAELIYDLRHENYSIYILDHRGQGFSGRLLDDRMKFHIDDFSNYVLDAKRFVDEIVDARPHEKKILLAHSMGGAIGALYLENYDDFSKAILSAPMLEIDTGRYSENTAYLMTKILAFIGFGKRYAVGKGPRVKEAFENSTITKSAARYWMWEELIQERMFPKIATGGPTNRWVREAISASREARSDAKKIDVPILLIQADLDDYVLPQGQNEFCGKAKGCRKVFFPGSKHEILMERDVIRDEALDEIRKFING